MENQEIECRFLEIEKDALIKKLLALGASDEGENLLEETVVYDSELKWRDGEEKKHVRLRKNGNKITLTYKENQKDTPDSHTYEIEFGVGNYEQAELFLKKVGLNPFRHQEKKRHTFRLNDVIFDIDTWPNVPPYVEIEGPSEQALKDAAALVGFDWGDVVFRSPRWVLENKYKIPVSHMKWFTFDRIE